jgi:hypothetical protein
VPFIDFIALKNSIRLLYFPGCSVFPSCVQNCFVMDYVFHSHNLFVPEHFDYIFLQNADCSVVKWLVSCSGQVECPFLALTLPQTLAFLSNNVSAYLTVLQKWLDKCDDFGLSFSLSDKTVSSKFCLSAKCIFILQI